MDGNFIYSYELYGKGLKPIVYSNDYYETEQEARFAAIGHITNLENGGE